MITPPFPQHRLTSSAVLLRIGVLLPLGGLGLGLVEIGPDSLQLCLQRQYAIDVVVAAARPERRLRVHALVRRAGRGRQLPVELGLGVEKFGLQFLYLAFLLDE